MSTIPVPIRAVVVPRSTVMTRVLLVAGGVTFLAVMAQIAVPVPGSPVPITGQTLAVLLIGASYGANLGAGTVLSYILVGALGLPVFAAGAQGWEKVIGATGGYLVGMALAAYIVGRLAERRWDHRVPSALSQMLIGQVAIFVPGLVWLKVYVGQSWSWTIAAGLTPFVVGEVLKMALAGLALPSLWRWVRRTGR